MRPLILCAALALAACGSTGPKPLDLDVAVPQWQALCVAVGPIGSPENNACVLQRYDTERVLAAQAEADRRADRAYRLNAYGLATRGY